MIELRKYPYPHVAALAICSDPDSTRSLDDYVQFHQWLATMATSDGEGLHISDGLFLQSKKLVSFLDEALRIDARVAEMVRKGQVDTIHSFGELDEEDGGAEPLHRALDALAAQGIRVPIWSNHSRSRFNLYNGGGDLPKSRHYHARATAQFGTQFIWFAGFSPVWGQDVPVRPAQLWEILSATRFCDPAAWRSLVGIVAKLILGRFLHRYVTYGRNRLLCPFEARDGTRFWSIMRYGARLGRDDRFKHLAAILSAARLDKLIRRGAAAIVYTHFGKADGDAGITNRAAVQRTFAALAQRTRAIWVAPTSRLLRYVVARDHLDWRVDDMGVVSVRGIKDLVMGYRDATATDLDGITFTSDRSDLRIEVPPGVCIERIREGDRTHYTLRMLAPSGSATTPDRRIP